MAAVRGHQVLPDMDPGLRRLACDCQVIYLHHHPAHCIREAVDENYGLGVTGSDLGVVRSHVHRNPLLLPASTLPV